MPLPNTDPKLGFPYDVTPAANSSFINNNTDASLIDDKVRELAAESAQAFAGARENFDYLNEREDQITRTDQQEFLAYFDGSAIKGSIVFPVDIQEVDETDRITVRQTPLENNVTGDAIGMVPEDTDFGDLAPVRTRGIIKDIFWPGDLTPPEEFQQVMIEYDAREGWKLGEPVGFDTNIIRPGQKLIGHYLSYDPGPPSVATLFLTGFQQSNLLAPNVVHSRVPANFLIARHTQGALNRDVFSDVVTGRITPRKSRLVKLTFNLYMYVPSTDRQLVIWQVMRGDSTLFDYTIRDPDQWQSGYSNSPPRGALPGRIRPDGYPNNSYPTQETQGIITRTIELLDEIPENDLGQEQIYAFKFRNDTADTYVLKQTFMRLEEVAI